MITNKAVSQLIKKYRLENNFSQEQLADLSGLDRTYISGVERSVRNITLESLERIIIGLDVELDVFFKDLSNEIKLQSKQ